MNDPIVNAARKYVDNLQLAWVSNTSITVDAGSARDSTNVNDIVVASQLTLNAAVVGANGIDAGALANTTLYAVHVIGDSTKYNDAACLLSTSATAPSLPSGYDMFRRIGYVRTDGAAQILKFYQYGADESRKMYYDAPISILAAGAAVAFTAVSLSAIAPAQAAVVMLDVDYTPAGATNIAEFQPFGGAGANGVVRYGCGVAAQQRGAVNVPAELDSSVPKILYKVSNAGDALTLLCAGYEDYLN